jgi:hypothetical protein
MATVSAEGLLRSVEEYAVRKLGRCGELFVAEVERNAPKRTRELVDSIESTTPVIFTDEVRMTVRVTATSDDGAPYPTFQNEGTGIFGPEGQPIRPKKPGGVLVFDWPAAGGIVFARSVIGTEPTRFWDKAVDEWPNILARVTNGG